MTTSMALPLFDAMYSSTHGAASTATTSDYLGSVAAEFVAAALADYRLIRKLDEVPIGKQPVFDRQVAILIRHMYDEWATQGEGLLKRIAAINVERSGDGRGTPGIEDLRDAVGRTRAMLSVSLEEIEEGIAECERGETIPLEEVRRELRAAAGR
jgi:hypothetical protein